MIWINYIPPRIEHNFQNGILSRLLEYLHKLIFELVQKLSVPTVWRGIITKSFFSKFLRLPIPIQISNVIIIAGSGVQSARCTSFDDHPGEQQALDHGEADSDGALATQVETIFLLPGRWHGLQVRPPFNLQIFVYTSGSQNKFLSLGSFKHSSNRIRVLLNWE